MLDALETGYGLQQAATLAEASAKFEAFTRHLGFTSYAYLGMRLPGRRDPLLLSTYPADWTEHYMSNAYHEVDPVVSGSAGGLLPFDWQSEQEWRKARGRQRQLFAEARDFGIACGMTVPVHAPRGGWSAVTVAGPEAGEDFAALLRERSQDLHVVSLHYHAAVERLTAPAQARKRLSPREIEVLHWTAEGKTAWEIGQILKISANTVTDYLESAKRKLGVYTKHHAVVVAIMEGLVAY